MGQLTKVLGLFLLGRAERAMGWEELLSEKNKCKIASNLDKIVGHSDIHVLFGLQLMRPSAYLENHYYTFFVGSIGSNGWIRHY